jgi:hypothetical protein
MRKRSITKRMLEGPKLVLMLLKHGSHRSYTFSSLQVKILRLTMFLLALVFCGSFLLNYILFEHKRELSFALSGLRKTLVNDSRESDKFFSFIDRANKGDREGRVKIEKQQSICKSKEECCLQEQKYCFALESGAYKKGVLTATVSLMGEKIDLDDVKKTWVVVGSKVKNKMSFTISANLKKQSAKFVNNLQHNNYVLKVKIPGGKAGKFKKLWIITQNSQGEEMFYPLSSKIKQAMKNEKVSL